MRIGVISDSHGNAAALEKAAEKAPDLDMWMHAGDYVQDAEYLNKITGLTVMKVAGNGDWNNPVVPEDEFIRVGGKKIWLTHGHKYQVKWGIDYLRELAEQNSADIVIFGHSHVYAEKHADGRMFLNPGSVSLPRDGKYGSFAVMEFSKNEASVRVCRYTI